MFRLVADHHAYGSTKTFAESSLGIFLLQFVMLQIAWVNRLMILERVVFSSSLLCARLFVTSLFLFLLKLRTVKILSLSGPRVT